MFAKESVPFAPALIESMRSLGYSFESAIADLIDNSISANAKNINIYMSPTSNTHLILFDDGHGMDDKEIVEAMRYGSKNPLESRTENDLGRFGLGLKSASLSQCRKLVVISKKNNKISAYSWDLDYIIEQGEWMLLGYDIDELDKFPQIDLFDNVESGTYILLENFDRVAESTNNLIKTLAKHMDNTIDHLSLVFHRYIDDGLNIFVNNEIIEARDPFLVDNKKTQIKRTQKINIEGSEVVIKPYILPHLSNLTNEDIRKVGSKEKLRNEQGFYVYRNKRLIIWGTWFRLERKDELSKLARVMVDIPNSLDYMWSIDIKKSSANLPDKIKQKLYHCAYESVSSSENVHMYRGRKVNENVGVNYIWERIKVRDGYEYRINREIPQIKLLEENLDKYQIKLLDKLIHHLEDSFPINSLYLDATKGEVKELEVDLSTNELFDEVLEQVQYAKENDMDHKSILKAFMLTEPYCSNKELLLRLKEIEGLGEGVSSV